MAASSASADKQTIDLKPEFDSLRDLIRKKAFPGDFFCSGVLPVIPNIQFKDVKTFLDPSFSEESESGSSRNCISIKDLISLCSEAPFGRDDTTVVDKTVRSCWQLDPDKFTIVNSDTWTDAFADLKQSVCSVLAPGHKLKNAELRLYKLLVYEKGSFFLPHRDTQRDENHFGTVVLSLPVKHTGGALFVRHMGQERSHKLEPGRVSTKCQWAAFFTDVEHEIKEIKSGNRITLVYHLYRTGTVKLVPPVLTAQHPIVKKLESIQEYLIKIDNEELEYVPGERDYKEFDDGEEDLGVEQYAYAGYILEHKYTPASLKPKNLKGKDAFLYHLLTEANFGLRLVAIEVRVDSSGPDDEGCCDLYDLMDEFTKVEFSELDISAPKEEAACSGGWPGDRGKKRNMFPSRPMEEVTWLVHDIANHAKALKRVDQYIRGTGNEGCDWHSTYLTSALVISLRPGQGKGIKRKYTLEHTSRPYPDFGP